MARELMPRLRSIQAYKRLRFRVVVVQGGGGDVEPGGVQAESLRGDALADTIEGEQVFYRYEHRLLLELAQWVGAGFLELAGALVGWTQILQPTADDAICCWRVFLTLAHGVVGFDATALRMTEDDDVSDLQRGYGVFDGSSGAV